MGVTLGYTVDRFPRRLLFDVRASGARFGE